MNKGLILAAGTVLALSSCATYAGAGAFTGASFGGVLGSAIGGLTGGWRGSNVGTIVGMATGAVVGAASGATADQAEQQPQYTQGRSLSPEERQEVLDHYHQMQQDRAQQQGANPQDGTVAAQPQAQDNSGYDPNNAGDDRLYDFKGSDYNGNYSAGQPTTMMPDAAKGDNFDNNYQYNPQVEIVNARFVDANRDNMISPNEVCKVIFEIMNRGNQTIYDIQPSVVEATGDRHISISPAMHIEQIEPGKGIRYTAIVKADKRIKSSNVKIRVSVLQGGKTISKVSEFNIAVKR